MPGRSIRIARIAGIPVGISPLWLVIVALITWSLGSGYYPDQVHGISRLASYALGLASALLLFASILAHEFGHAVVARRRGVGIEEIDLWLLGGVARMTSQPKSAEDELSFALAGPAVTAVVAAAFGALTLLLGRAETTAMGALVRYQAEINLLILGFNLLPAFPLDGGRVARALMWRRSGDLSAATETAAALGRGLGYLLVGLGVLTAFNGAPGGLWFAVIGFFLIAAAGAERVHAQVTTMFSGVPVGSLMSTPASLIPSRSTLDEAAGRFAEARFTAFPVTDSAGRAVGMLRIDQLERLPLPRRGGLTVADVMNRDPKLRVTAQTDVSELLDQPEFVEFGRAVVIDASGHPLGVISRTDIDRTVRARNLYQRTA